MAVYALIIAYLGVTMYAANQVQIRLWEPGILRFFLYSAVFVMGFLAFIPIQTAVLTQTDLPEAAQIIPISLPIALITSGFAALCAALSFATIRSETTRQRIAQVIGRAGRFDADSAVHATAVVLSCFLLTGVVVLFVLSGGQEALAESIESGGIDPLDTLLTLMLQVLAGALGVGYAIRRSEGDTLARLGLKAPTSQDWVVGILSGLGLFVISRIFLLAIIALTSPEQLQQQTQAAEQVTLALLSLPIALLVSLSAAIGEEIFVRGALQPIFGIWISSAFFTLLHTQYFITPSLLLIFALSVIFGILRNRYNTTTAIITHFVYNFTPLLLLIMLGEAAVTS